LKVTGSPFRLVLASGLHHLSSFLTRSYLALAIAAVAFFALQRSDRRLWLLAALVLGHLAYDVWSGSDWIEQYTSRFFAPALPLSIIAVVGAAWRICERLVPERRLRWFALASLLSIPVFNTTTSVEEWCNPFQETMFRSWSVTHHRKARYLQKHTRPDATLAVHWAGVLPYFLDRSTIDVLGKCDRHIARMSVPRFLPGHSKWDWDYILAERKPDLIDYVSRDLDKRADFVALYDRADIAGMSFFVRKGSREKLF
jgi:hypothetical protein